MPIRPRLLVFLVLFPILGLLLARSLGQTEGGDSVLAVVNGKSITESDMAFLMLSRRIPEDQKAKVRSRFLEILIERQLMRDYLDSQKAEPSRIELDQQVSRIRKVIRESGDDPDKVLAKMGITEESLRKELALPLAWKSHLRLAVSNDRLRKYYEKHREKFDGTEVRVRQIFLKLPADAEDETVAAAEKKLQNIRAEIKQGKWTFAEAARRFSEAPSKDDGGETGWITYRGKLPAQVSDAAFALEVGEVSEPIRSPFGQHLVTVTDRKPGQLSLEDTRAVVFNHLSQKLWQESVKAQRDKAQIEIRR